MLKNIEKLGIKTLKILGGEPTVREDLEDIIRFLNNETGLEYAILSNSHFDDKGLTALLTRELWDT